MLVEQIALQFPHCFWNEELDYFGAALEGDASQRGLCSMFWSLQRFSGAPVLLALVSGDAAYASEGRTVQELQQSAMQVLRQLHGDAIPDPIASDLSQWMSDPHARGMTPHAHDIYGCGNQLSPQGGLL